MFQTLQHLRIQLFQTAHVLDQLKHRIEVVIQIFLCRCEQLREELDRGGEVQLLDVHLHESVHLFFEEVLDRVEKVLL